MNIQLRLVFFFRPFFLILNPHFFKKNSLHVYKLNYPDYLPKCSYFHYIDELGAQIHVID